MTTRHHIFLSPLQLHKHSKLHTKLSLLIDKYVQDTKGQRGAKQLEVFRYHWQWVLLGLSRSLLTNSWLLLALIGTHTQATSGCNAMTSNTASVKPIVDYLEAQGLVKGFEGQEVQGTALTN